MVLKNFELYKELTARGKGAANRTKTHCPQGHEYNEENTTTYRDGNYNMRLCNKCNRDRSRERQRRLRKEK
jgi:hypothetical protein